MQHMRRWVAGAVGAMVLAGSLTGCLFETDGTDGKDDKAGAPSEPKLGDKGTACELPVRFTLEKPWKAKEVDKAVQKQIGPLADQGPVTIVCELDAKPAGHIGFIRVLTGTKDTAAPGGTSRALMRAFVKDANFESRVKLREVKAGDLPATEAGYYVTDLAAGEIRPVRALAVMTERGGVVLELGGMDAEEHKAMLPAFRLAKESMEKMGGKSG
ncbi:lipoprotein [Streptomyces sp. NEAU-Y11]|uniref:lipoprotein n=1 Tax=Streptomyces cucumeris TaxID=2962890 RepID=UPI0020C900C6|nr:lipoprotein [Streptomyces sp. NEAU-Y11]MCP9209043.1 lipoprotein [Streptomyces sp. NEAU-Y11]